MKSFRKELWFNVPTRRAFMLKECVLRVYYPWLPYEGSISVWYERALKLNN